MKTLGIVFSNIHDHNIPELTSKRTVASVPFCGRYRLIDFALSNMINSEITKVGIITKSNYQSLMDHVGSGKDWDLARHEGGLFILPPFGATDSNSLYTTRLEALKNILGFLNKSTEQFVVLSDSDMILNIDYRKLQKFHLNNKSDITMVYTKQDMSNVGGVDPAILTVNKYNKVTEIMVSPKLFSGEVNLYCNIMFISRTLLINILRDAISHGRHHFLSEVIVNSLNILNVCAYEHTGHFKEIDSLQTYYEENLALLDRNLRDEVFRNVNILTKVKDSVPTKYGSNAVVKNSLIADGCQIEGEVYNSIIFRGVKVGRGTVVKNCILMQNTITGENVNLNCIITDKDVVIRDRRVLSGCETHPFFINKNMTI